MTLNHDVCQLASGLLSHKDRLHSLLVIRAPIEQWTTGVYCKATLLASSQNASRLCGDQKTWSMPPLDVEPLKQRSVPASS